MRLLRLLIVLLFMVFLQTSARGATPTLIQAVSCSNIQTNTVTDYKCNLPNTTLSGNALFVFATIDVASAATITINDDQSNAYTVGLNFAGSNQRVWLGCTMATTGTRSFTVHFSTQTSSDFVQAAAAEFNNITNCTKDVSDSTGGGGLSTTVTCGTGMTPTATNDLILHYMINQNPGPATPITYTPGTSPWTILSADVQDGQVIQYQVDPNTSSITPTLTASSSIGWDTVCVAYKSSTTGTAIPAGIRVVRMVHNAVTPGNSTTSVKVQLPGTSGNMLFIDNIDSPSSPDYKITLIADQDSHSFSEIGSPFQNADSGLCQRWHSDNITFTSRTNIITLTMTSSGPAGGSTFQVFEITGAATSPFDVDSTASGGASGNFTGGSVTPTTSNGLVFSQVANAGATIIGGSPGNFLSNTLTPNPGTASVDQNNGWKVYPNPNTSTVTDSWTVSGTPGNWASTLTAFKAAPVGASPIGVNKRAKLEKLDW